MVNTKKILSATPLIFALLFSVTISPGEITLQQSDRNQGITELASVDSETELGHSPQETSFVQQWIWANSEIQHLVEARFTNRSESVTFGSSELNCSKSSEMSQLLSTPTGPSCKFDCMTSYCCFGREKPSR